jgi:8-oxo-dGTP diphosphatase
LSQINNINNQIVNRFNIRVYGFLLNQNNQVLISAENYMNKQFIKFPGGGLEFGEGTKDCLIRELKEEANIDIQIVKHLYTTDFFIASVFKKTDQLISIYYQIKLQNESDAEKFQLGTPNFPNTATKESLAWMPLNDINQELLTFPIDKKIIQLVKSKQITLNQ